MTRVLSELLGAPEPNFRLSLQRLEAASGHPNNDIRLTTEINLNLQNKIRQLGLDPHDTTGIELYQALKQRIQDDDHKLKVALLKLSISHADEALVSHIASAINRLPLNEMCFAIKPAVVKRFLKKIPPKQTQKALAYRSLDSMLKHENPAALFAAAKLLEGVTWHRSVLDYYKKLTPADFETRDIVILNPHSKRWIDFAADNLNKEEHNNLLSIDELGAIILFPLEEHPIGTTIALAGLTLEGINEIHSTSTYLKLCQVKFNFGEIVKSVASHEPCLTTKLLDQPVSWRLIQRYYSRFEDSFRADVFEPHIQPIDLTWHSAEKVLARIEPSLNFWAGTSYLGMVHDGVPVSMNILDTALNYCNKLPYGNHIVHYLRQSLASELSLRYFKHENVERAVLGELRAELEPVVI